MKTYKVRIKKDFLEIWREELKRKYRKAWVYFWQNVLSMDSLEVLKKYAEKGEVLEAKEMNDEDIQILLKEEDYIVFDRSNGVDRKIVAVVLPKALVEFLQ